MNTKSTGAQAGLCPTLPPLLCPSCPATDRHTHVLPEEISVGSQLWVCLPDELHHLLHRPARGVAAAEPCAFAVPLGAWGTAQHGAELCTPMQHHSSHKHRALLPTCMQQHLQSCIPVPHLPEARARMDRARIAAPRWIPALALPSTPSPSLCPSVPPRAPTRGAEPA